MNQNIKEPGAAKIIIELSDGVIVVKHGDSGEALARWTANAGDWEKLWATIKQFQAMSELITTYHAFTDNRDDWFNTLSEARACIDQWRADGHINLRIYEEQSEKDGETVNEDCVFSEGDFPY